jgi:hypothetical protein
MNNINNDDNNATAIAILLTALDEQRRFHDEITKSFDSIKSKIVLYIGAMLTVLTFLYSGALDVNKTMQERLFIPKELYGMLFYFFGIVCLIYALFELIRAMRIDTQWEVYSETTERRIVGCIDNTLDQKKYLQEMVNGYEAATHKNLNAHGIKSVAIQTAFSPMIGGAIILVVLRFFQ